MKRQRYKGPCGHYTPDVRVQRIVRGHRPGFEAQVTYCSKCGEYYAPFNVNCLPAPLQEELDRYGVVRADDIHRFLERAFPV